MSGYRPVFANLAEPARTETPEAEVRERLARLQPLPKPAVVARAPSPPKVEPAGMPAVIVVRDGKLRAPMRSMQSLMARPQKPLIECDAAIERLLAPLGRDGSKDRSKTRKKTKAKGP